MRWLTGQQTGTWVPLFATGPGAERFAGVLDNDELGQRMAAVLGLEGVGEPLPTHCR